MGEPGVWAHMVVTYDNRMLRVYKDGELVAETEKDHNIIWNAEHNGNQLNLAGGWSDKLDDHRRYFNGLISDAQVWDRALNQEEIQAIYNQQL